MERLPAKSADQRVVSGQPWRHGPKPNSGFLLQLRRDSLGLFQMLSLSSGLLSLHRELLQQRGACSCPLCSFSKRVQADLPEPTSTTAASFPGSLNLGFPAENAPMPPLLFPSLSCSWVVTTLLSPFHSFSHSSVFLSNLLLSLPPGLQAHGY